MAVCACCTKVSEADSLVLAFIISGITIIRVTRHPSQRQLTCAMLMNILCIIVTIISTILTVVELSSFESVSYRNYGQAKLGREISRVLLSFYTLELCIAFTYTIFGCVGLGRGGRTGSASAAARASGSGTKGTAGEIAPPWLAL
ncbi:hypothetical protein G4228_000406 [Cervus hanglu yarkandensis]|nr:hypothetical protein G4228_000406 [Cervus hanglu yarkandensis]